MNTEHRQPLFSRAIGNVSYKLENQIISIKPYRKNQLGSCILFIDLSLFTL